MQKKTIKYRHYFRRATALLLVVVLLAMLAIIGTTFVITSRIENVAVQNQMQAIGMEQSLKAICAEIQEDLAEDLWGHRLPTANSDLNFENRQRLLGLPCDQNGKTLNSWGGSNVIENEPWDAAWVGDLTNDKAKYYYFDGSSWKSADVLVDGDPWLASMTPNASSNWERGSDILNLATSDFDNIPAKAISDPTTTDDDLEKYADADGDGVLDSVWVVQEGFFKENSAGSGIYYADINGDGNYEELTDNLPIKAPEGLCYRMAVRIVDTCGMVNINTAWTVPSDYVNIGHPEYFLGNLLSGVKLYDNNFGYGSDLPGRETGNAPDYSFAKMLVYQNSYIFKIEDPDWDDLNNNFNSDFYPLDISDELELRYRWNVNNPNVKTTFENHFNPTKRYCLSAYSFSRHIRRESAATTLNVDTHFPTAYNLENTIKDLIGYVKDPSGYDSYINGLGSPETENRKIRLKLFVKYIKQALKADNNYADSSAISPPAEEYHTWQYIANLVDYLDNDLDSSGNPIDVPTVIDTSNSTLQGVFGLSAVDTDQSGGTDNKVYGLERHLAVTEVELTCTQQYDGSTTPVTPALYQVRVELYNPWASPVTEGTGHRPICELYWNGTKQSPDAYGPTSLNADNFYVTSFTTQISINSDPTSSSGDLTIVLKASNGAPEDVFHIHINNLPNTLNAISDWQRHTQTSPSPDVNNDRWRALTNQIGGPYSSSEMGAHNTQYQTASHYSGYVTSTCAWSITDVHRNPNHPTNTNLWDSVTIGGSNTYYFAKLHNFFDIAAVPYVGYVIDSTGMQKGICDWVKQSDDKIHFDFTKDGIYGTATKAGQLRDTLFEAFKLLNRSDDGKDQLNYDLDNNENTGADNIDEMRLPGLININTASSEVLQALHSYIHSTEGNNIANSTNKPFKTIGYLLEKQSSDFAPSGSDFFIKGLHNTQDVVENSAKWSRIANLITNRSDTFCAYILIEALDKSGTVQSKQRWIVLFDRSMCNKPPLIWDATSSSWRINPNYRKPKIVAMQRIE